ncbi:hypothetical protein CPB84DRAFT_1339590 [Gymnopilus junonius]|uniref:Uncharacterized protein n=1 Tax=Gymnopilus junonius TaxID=109634 RepID=A0A9P5NM44_GYMJU|nr:hypothetical protein CPB84DRAFT_1339590 [Gymnopilus junonius]
MFLASPRGLCFDLWTQNTVSWSSIFSKPWFCSMTVIKYPCSFISNPPWKRTKDVFVSLRWLMLLHIFGLTVLFEILPALSSFRTLSVPPSHLLLRTTIIHSSGRCRWKGARGDLAKPTSQLDNCLCSSNLMPLNCSFLFQETDRLASSLHRFTHHDEVPFGFRMINICGALERRSSIEAKDMQGLHPPLSPLKGYFLGLLNYTTLVGLILMFSLNLKLFAPDLSFLSFDEMTYLGRLVLEVYLTVMTAHLTNFSVVP